MTKTGWKTLRSDGRSIRNNHNTVLYPLPAGDQPGAWIDVPGNGSYVSMDGTNLFAGGIGDILVRVEVDQPIKVDNTPDGVSCYRRIRVVAVVDWLNGPITDGYYRYLAALDITGLTDEDRRKLVLPITTDQYRYLAAQYVKGLSDNERK